MGLSCRFLDISFKNPTVLASGIMDVTASSMRFVIENGAGAVVTKSMSLEPWEGHHTPILLVNGSHMMNAVGLTNPGAKVAVDEIREYRQKNNEPIIASIFAKTIDEFGEVASLISEARPDMIEVNISCPHVEKRLGKSFSHSCEGASAVTARVKDSTKIPISVKLSPNVTNLKEIAKAVEDSGADALTGVNTFGPGMEIDIETGKPVLFNRFGGVSGPAVRPLALKAVYDIYGSVNIPIMGCGGITTGEDAVKMLMAGASLTQIGSAVYFRGPQVFRHVCEEMQEYMEKHNYSHIKDLIGIAHDRD